MTVATKILSFLKNIELTTKLPENVEVMNPFRDASTFQLCESFYTKYYSDRNPRFIIIGINPGRFGAGMTGVPFTDPVRLETICGITNDFQKKRELSSVFIYEMINAFGGPENFYGRFYISSISPLGFTKNNKNLNYYDDKELEKKLKPFVIDNIEKQLRFGIKNEIAFCLGEGKNFHYLSRLNDEMKFFKKICPLPHPRFIMQYRLKAKEEYIDRYLRELNDMIQ
ncbi:MAG: uracil-DNA glycosylase family protein [Ginsengibacter sp.]